MTVDPGAQAKSDTTDSGLIGHRFIYTYANGWQYEMYVKNATTIDYRIHTGHVGGR
jgi:phenolic acid decarboxylase